MCRLVFSKLRTAVPLALLLTARADGALLKMGDVLVSANTNGVSQLVAYDPLGFDQKTVISGGGIGTGPDIPGFNVVVDANGSIYSSGGPGGTSIVRIDPTTGNRSSIYAEVAGQPSMGSGPAITSPIGMVVAGNGNLFVAGSNAIFQIDQTTLDRTILSDSTHGTGPWNGTDLRAGMALDTNGDIILANYSGRSIIRVNHTTGDRETIS